MKLLRIEGEWATFACETPHEAFVAGYLGAARSRDIACDRDGEVVTLRLCVGDIGASMLRLA